jgi:hypothetical protein
MPTWSDVYQIADAFLIAGRVEKAMAVPGLLQCSMGAENLRSRSDEFGAYRAGVQHP